MKHELLLETGGQNAIIVVCTTIFLLKNLGFLLLRK